MELSVCSELFPLGFSLWSDVGLDGFVIGSTPINLNFRSVHVTDEQVASFLGRVEHRLTRQSYVSWDTSGASSSPCPTQFQIRFRFSTLDGHPQRLAIAADFYSAAGACCLDEIAAILGSENVKLSLSLIAQSGEYNLAENEIFNWNILSHKWESHATVEAPSSFSSSDLIADNFAAYFISLRMLLTPVGHCRLLSYGNGLDMDKSDAMTTILSTPHSFDMFLEANGYRVGCHVSFVTEQSQLMGKLVRNEILSVRPNHVNGEYTHGGSVKRRRINGNELVSSSTDKPVIVISQEISAQTLRNLIFCAYTGQLDMFYTDFCTLTDILYAAIHLEFKIVQDLIVMLLLTIDPIKLEFRYASKLLIIMYTCDFRHVHLLNKCVFTIKSLVAKKVNTIDDVVVTFAQYEELISLILH